MTFTEFLEDVAEFCIKALKIAGIIILVLVVCFIAYKIISSIIKKKRLQKTIADIAQICSLLHRCQRVALKSTTQTVQMYYGSLTCSCSQRRRNLRSENKRHLIKFKQTAQRRWQVMSRPKDRKGFPRCKGAG